MSNATSIRPSAGATSARLYADLSGAPWPRGTVGDIPLPKRLAPARPAALRMTPRRAGQSAPWRAALALLLLGAGLAGFVPGASAQTEVPHDWPLQPAGLSEGDEFRLLFATSGTRDATPTGIGAYNTFVQDQAAAGHSAIQFYSAGFRVVACTETTDARDNTSTRWTGSDRGVPIYWLGGNKVVDHYQDFYDGKWDDSQNVRDQQGNDRDLANTTSRGDKRPFTGCLIDGTKHASEFLGTTEGLQRVRLGAPDTANANASPLSALVSPPAFNKPKGESRAFYALSQVFRAGPSPEAATGRPTIGGLPVAGATLTAFTSDISDPNGLTGATFTYQWIRFDGGAESDISGATGETYTLTAADRGEKVKVRVAFTDDDGFNEMRTSLAWPAQGTITGQAGAPTLDRAWVDGRNMVLKYSEPLNTAQQPGRSAWRVSVNGGTRTTPGAASVSGREVRLTLSSAVGAGDAVTVSYTVPTLRPLLDAGQGLAAAPLSDRRVNNITGPGPEVDQAKFHHIFRSQILVSFSTNLRRHKPFPTDLLTVKAGGQTVDIKSANTARWINKTANHPARRVLEIFLARPVLPELDVTVSYGDPTSGNDSTAVQDLNGVDAPSFHDVLVASRTTDLTPPKPAQPHPFTVKTESGNKNYVPKAVLRWGWLAEVHASRVQLQWAPTGAGPWRDVHPDGWDEPSGGNLTVNYYKDLRVCGGEKFFYRLRASRYHKQSGSYVHSDWKGPVNIVPFQGSAGFTSPGKTCVNRGSVSAGPTLRSATTDASGTEITLRFGAPLLREPPTSRPPVSAFTVKVDGTPVTLDTTDDVESPDRNSFRVKLSGTFIRPGQTVTVSYADPTSGDDTAAIQDTDGDDAGSFTDIPVANRAIARVSACQSGDLWCATLTVEQSGGGTGSTFGFRRSSGLGSLSDDDFVYDGTTYEIDRFAYDQGEDQLVFELDPAGGTVFDDPAFALVLDGRPFSLDGRYLAGDGLFDWSSPNLGWTDGQSVSVRLVRTDGAVSNSQNSPPETTPLTASVESKPDAHDGETAFDVRIAFSETLHDGFSWKTLRDEAFTVTGGEVLGARRVVSTGDERNRRWDVIVEPAGDGDVTLVLGTGPDCRQRHALCTEDGRQLSAGLTVTVAGPEEETQAGLTARFVAPETDHDGATAFPIRIAFSETLKNQALGSKVVKITGGAHGGSERVGGENEEIWQVAVTPDGNGDVVISLVSSDTCGSGIACTEGDLRPLSAGIQHRVKGPALLSVADASATEGTDTNMTFTVELSRSLVFPITVDYATVAGTATAPEDYTATSGTLTFSAGQTAKTVQVAIVDDGHDDDGETFTLTLSNPSGAVIDDGTATGTIHNSDAMPRAWLARFGRTVAGQVLEAVESRMQAPRAPGAEASLAGERIGLGPLFGADGEDPAPAAAREARASLETKHLADWLRGETDPAPRHGAPAPTVTERDLMLGSSFSLTAAAGAGPGGTVSLWGRGAVSRFDGREGAMTLDGEVASGLLGADWSWGPGLEAGPGRTTAGLIVGHSRGDGGYRADAGGGTVASTLTGVYPWARHAFSERLSAWGVAGYGEGALTLTPEGPDGGSRAALRSDLGLAMGAAGVRGVLLAAPAGGGPALAVKADALGVRTTSATVPGLAAADADVTRLRLGLEGAWAVRLEGGGTLTPMLEIGVRHDGGDAETGAGADLGGGLAWRDPARGLSAELRGRGLLAHEADGFRERGLSGTLSFDPTPDTERGLALTLTQTIGAAASGGMDALLGRGTMAELVGAAHGDDLASRRFELRLGYGLAASGRFASTPEAALARSDGHREYSLGWRLTLAGRGAGALELRLEATRREPAGDPAPGAGPEHGVGIRAAARW